MEHDTSKEHKHNHRKDMTDDHKDSKHDDHVMSEDKDSNVADIDSGYVHEKEESLAAARSNKSTE